MSCIYKEKAVRDKLPFLILIVVMAVLLLSVSTLTKEHIISENVEIAVDTVLVLLFLYMIYRMHRSLNTVIKYSIISGELLVQKKTDDDTELLDRIYTESIKEIRPVCSPLERLLISFRDVSFLFKKVYRIRYTDGGQEKKIYLRSSEKLIERLKEIMDYNGSHVSIEC